jgi:hypothetical protein
MSGLSAHVSPKINKFASLTIHFRLGTEKALKTSIFSNNSNKNKRLKHPVSIYTEM